MHRRAVGPVAAALLLVAVASAAAPADRQAQVDRILTSELRPEVTILSPSLLTAVDWQRIERTLLHAGQPPALWLARATLLVQAYYLSDWPMDQRLALLRAYAKDDHAPVRRLAVDLLAREDAIKAGSLADLRDVVKGETDPGVKVEAARKLLEHNDPAGWEPLLALLYSDDPKVQASGAVQESPHREAKETLIDLSLERWGFGANAARLPEPLRLTPDQVALATRAFAMTDNVIRRTVVELIGLSRDRKRFALLKGRVEAETAWTVLRSLYISLGYLGDPAAIPILKGAIDEPKVDRVGRMAPAMGLAFLGDTAALKTLVAQLETGKDLPVLCRALSRAFDPAFDEEGDLFLVPDKEGRIVPTWIPAASSGFAPMIDDGRGGTVRAPALTAGEVHAAWKAFLDANASRLTWDAAACRFTLRPAGAARRPFGLETAGAWDDNEIVFRVWELALKMQTRVVAHRTREATQ